MPKRELLTGWRVRRCAVMLQQAKADIEIRDKQGRTAVHRCAEQDLFELMLWVKEVKGDKVRGILFHCIYRLKIALRIRVIKNMI